MVTHADTTQKEKDLLIQVLTQHDLCDKNTIAQFEQQAHFFQQTLFQYIMQHQLIDPEKLCIASTLFFQCEKASLDNEYDFTPSQHFSTERIQSYFMLPIVKNNQWTIIIANPDDYILKKTLSFQLTQSTCIQFARYDILRRLHNQFVCKHFYKKILLQDEKIIQELTHLLLSDAVHQNASDIHFEPCQHQYRVRFRIDGLLHHIIFLPSHFSETIVSCIKILAQLDIAIKRIPQDGRLTLRSYLGYYKDARINTCPTIYGEKIVVRLLDANTQIKPINQLGLFPADQQLILKILKKPQGLILVTGPTGSGKTITLYTLLHLLNQDHRNIMTLEDPVEMQINGINQICIQTKMGLTFQQTLRALLRQDPDVIMIGEIRDEETAEIAISAAQTGHLVLSTLHTNSAAEAITRLHHMKIKPIHLASALLLIIAQRLIRKRCMYCETGCLYCVSGFQGRTGIFELLPTSESIKQLILNQANHIALQAENQRNGHGSLGDAAAQCVSQRITTLTEINRVVSHHE